MKSCDTTDDVIGHMTSLNDGSEWHQLSEVTVKCTAREGRQHCIHYGIFIVNVFGVFHKSFLPSSYSQPLGVKHLIFTPHLTFTLTSNFDLEFWPWTWPSTLTSDLDLYLKPGWKSSKCHVKTHFLTVWPWPMTYNLDIQSQPSHGQGRPKCQKSRLKVKGFKS